MNPTQAQQSLKDAQTTNPMKIPSIGNYLTQDGQTAIVDDIAGDTCLGRISRGGDPVVWDRVTGKAFLANGTSAPHLSIVSTTPIPWRERIIQLIETAHRHSDRINRPYMLVSGSLCIAIGGGGGCVVLTKDGVEPVFLNSPEIIEAVDARLKELKEADLRHRDDANAAAIEALLQ